MSLRLNGSTSGYVELEAPATAGNNTLILPDGSGNADQVLVTDGSGTLSFANRGRMVLETEQASTSGTSIDFTGIPSWAKKITIMFDGVSTNGSSIVQVQLGAGSITTTGYNSSSASTNSTSNGTSSTTGIVFTNYAQAADLRTGHMSLSNIGSFSWIASHTAFFPGNAFGTLGAGNITLSGTLDRIRITTVNGTDTFDAGSINIMYEG